MIYLEFDNANLLRQFFVTTEYLHYCWVDRSWNVLEKLLYFKVTDE